MDLIGIIGLGVGLVVLAIAVNAMVRKNTGMSSPKIDQLEQDVKAKAEEAAAKAAEAVKAKIDELKK